MDTSLTRPGFQAFSGATTPPIGKGLRGHSIVDANAGQPDDRQEVWLVNALCDRVPDGKLRSAIGIWEAKRKRSARTQVSDTLIQLGIISQQEYAKLVSAHYGLPLFAGSMATVTLTQELIRILPLHIARRCKAVVVGVTGPLVQVAVAEPTSRVLDDLFRAFQNAGKAGDATRIDGKNRAFLHEVFIAPSADILAKLEQASQPKRKSIADEKTAAQFLDQVLKDAIELNASDVHIVPQEKSIEVRYRIDGEMRTHHVVEESSKRPLIAAAKTMGNLDLGKPNIPLDGATAFKPFGSMSYKIRFSSLPTQYGECVVMRILADGASAIALSDLGLSESDFAAVTGAIEAPFGLCVACGPTGSGKSTLLAAAVSTISGEYAIRTLENPIEYRLPNAIQTEVSQDMPFALALRSILRQDPDYIMVGEIRDRETASIAIEAGLTGHTCFTTVHGNDAIGGMIRMLELCEPGPMAASCNVFVAQRLVRRLCKCAKPLSPRERDELLTQHRAIETLKDYNVEIDPSEICLMEPVGCPHCLGAGYKGRVGVFETRKMADFRDIISVKGHHAGPECREVERANKMKNLRVDGIHKVVTGITTFEELFKQV